MKQKRLLSLLLAVCLVLCLAPFGTSAEETVTSGTCGDNLTWNFDEVTGKLIISGEGEMIDYDSSTITAPWHDFREKILYVDIAEGVASIGVFAFYDCSSLTKISLPASLAHIGSDAFMDCSSLTEIDLPESLTSIGGAAFYGCTSLAKITIPSGVTSIEGAAFVDCRSLTEIDLPEGLTSIEDDLFVGCRSLTEIEIPASVTKMGYSIFQLCENLNAIKFIGDAPEFFEVRYTEYEDIVYSGTFSGLTALIYFPADNETWTEEVLSGNYGGTLTWVPYRDYEILDGAESTWDPDSGEGLTVRADGALADFVAVKVDGVEVPAEHYTVTEGSTIVTLSADYLETLSEGPHTLTVMFADGVGETTFTILASSEPDPTEPTPTEPEPTEPEPTEPEPTEPDPTEPTPTEPEPTEPEPTEPEPTEPDPTEPTPTEPNPTEPTPTEPVEGDAAQTDSGDIIYLFITLVAITGIGLAAIAVIERKRFRF